MTLMPNGFWLRLRSRAMTSTTNGDMLPGWVNRKSPWTPSTTFSCASNS
jgi:hypothetical protein